jgi:hypothetical protein
MAKVRPVVRAKVVKAAATDVDAVAVVAAVKADKAVRAPKVARPARSLEPSTRP